MRVVVTGGAGFIGSHLTELLIKNGHSVIVIDNFSTGSLENLKDVIESDSLQVFNKNIINFDEIKDLFEGVDWVFHLAAMLDVTTSLEKPREYFDTNIKGTINVLEAARKKGVKKVVFASSCAIYSDASLKPINEQNEIVTKNPYALTKYLAEKIILSWDTIYNLPCVCLRLFNVYGPRSREEGAYCNVINIFNREFKNGQPITVVGDGKQIRDFVNVFDVIRAFLMAAESNLSSEVFNVGTGKALKIIDLATKFDSNISYLPKRDFESQYSEANINKIKKESKWSPEKDIFEEIKHLLKK